MFRFHDAIEARFFLAVTNQNIFVTTHIVHSLRVIHYWLFHKCTNHLDVQYILIRVMIESTTPRPIFYATMGFRGVLCGDAFFCAYDVLERHADVRGLRGSFEQDPVP